MKSSDNKKSILYFSPKFRNKLKDISHNKIAKALVEAEGEFIEQNITLIDVEPDYYLTFIPMDKAQKIINDYHPYASGVDISNVKNLEIADALWQRKNENGIAPVYDKNRNKIKIGKLVNKLLNQKFSTKEIEDFVNLFKSTNSDINNVFEIVSGDDITKWYDINRYYETKGTLGGSCMKYGKYFDIYKDNESTCRMLILKRDNYLLGRALVWKIKKINKFKGVEYFMDRIYTSDDYHRHNFINYAEKQGWAFKTYNSYTNPNDVTYRGKSNNNVKMSVKVLPGNYNIYPYMDTFKRYNSKEGILYNDDKYYLGGFILCSTNGDYRSTKSKLFKKIFYKFKDIFN